jgi:hypothetical protein
MQRFLNAGIPAAAMVGAPLSENGRSGIRYVLIVRDRSRAGWRAADR